MDHLIKFALWFCKSMVSQTRCFQLGNLEEMSGPDILFSNTSILHVTEEENKHIFLFKRKRPITSLKGFGFILQSEV